MKDVNLHGEPTFNLPTANSMVDYCKNNVFNMFDVTLPVVLLL